jgi:hypothetical protein
MTHSPENLSPPAHTLDEIYEAFAVPVESYVELAKMLSARDIAASPRAGYQVKDGILIAPSGNERPVPSEQDIETAKQQVDSDEADIRARFEFAKNVNLGEVHRITSILRTNERNAGQKHFIPRVPEPDTLLHTVPEFLRAAHAIAVATETPVKVWQNGYLMSQVTVQPDTDIEAVIIEARQLDDEGLKDLQENWKLTPEEREYNTSELIESWYRDSSVQ